MRTLWENNGEPNEDGDYIAKIEPEADKKETGGTQRFIGKSHKEVADQLLDAQMNATQKIHTMTRAQEALEPKPSTTPAAMSADELFEVGAGLQDPAKAVETVEKIMERAVGAPLEKVRETFNREAAAAQREQILALEKQWLADNPDFLPCKPNEDMMHNFLDTHKAAVTAKNLDIAFARLKEAGLLVFAPDGGVVEEPPPAVPASGQPGGLPANSPVTIRPRTVHSTGIRSAEISGTATTTEPPQKYTLEQVERMGRKEYAEKLDNDPAFRAFISSTAAATR